MKLYYSATSPYVRKVMVTAIEKGLDGKIERLSAAASPVKPDMTLSASNPLGKVPCLITDDGQALFDSAVITAYIDQLKAPHLIPTDAKGRFACMTLESLADGFLDAGILLRYEHAMRPEAKRWDDWVNGQMGKIERSMDALETTYASQLTGPLTVGQIAVACALGWFDFRYGQVAWRNSRPKLAAFTKAMAERPSMKATMPVG